MDYDKLVAEFLVSAQLIQREKQKKGISLNMQGESFILHIICIKGSVVPKEISKAVGVSSARIAVILNDLEKKGLITREIDRDDRRQIIVKLTENGRRQADENERAFMQRIKQLFIMLGEKDAKEYVRIYGRLAEVIKTKSI